MIEWLPTANELVVNVAVNGVVADSVPLPIVVVPSRKFTTPVGLPVPEVTVTVAVKVTGCPKTDGLTDEATAVEVVPLGGGLTVWVNAALVLPLKLASPA